MKARTKDEDKGIRLLQNLLDKYDYTGKIKQEVTEEENRLMKLGFDRFIREELNYYDYNEDKL